MGGVKNEQLSFLAHQWVWASVSFAGAGCARSKTAGTFKATAPAVNPASGTGVVLSPGQTRGLERNVLRGRPTVSADDAADWLNKARDSLLTTIFQPGRKSFKVRPTGNSPPAKT